MSKKLLSLHKELGCRIYEKERDIICLSLFEWKSIEDIMNEIDKLHMLNMAFCYLCLGKYILDLKKS